MMIDGITVLNQTPIMGLADWVFTAVTICSLIALVSFVFALCSKKAKFLVVWAIITAVSTLSIFVILIAAPKVETGRYQYEVTVGPYIWFEHVYEKYDVVGRRGEIWVLEDKERE